MRWLDKRPRAGYCVARASLAQRRDTSRGVGQLTPINQVLKRNEVDFCGLTISTFRRWKSLAALDWINFDANMTRRDVATYTGIIGWILQIHQVKTVDRENMCVMRAEIGAMNSDWDEPVGITPVGLEALATEYEVARKLSLSWKVATHVQKPDATVFVCSDARPNCNARVRLSTLGVPITYLGFPIEPEHINIAETRALLGAVAEAVEAHYGERLMIYAAVDSKVVVGVVQRWGSCNAIIRELLRQLNLLLESGGHQLDVTWVSTKIIPADELTRDFDYDRFIAKCRQLMGTWGLLPAAAQQQ